MPVTAPVKFTGEVAALLHTTWLTGATTSGVGLTVTVKVCIAPVQLFAEGVTVIIPVVGALVILVAVKEAIFPAPVVVRPIPGLLFVQLKVVPVTEPVKLTGAVAALLHNVWLAGLTTSGVGFTRTAKVCDAPVQLFAEGVTVIIPVVGALVILVAVKEAIFPAPVAARPMLELLFVQL